MTSTTDHPIFPDPHHPLLVENISMNYVLSVRLAKEYHSSDIFTISSWSVSVLGNHQRASHNLIMNWIISQKREDGRLRLPSSNPLTGSGKVCREERHWDSEILE
jgi:hypothetical protein